MIIFYEYDPADPVILLSVFNVFSDLVNSLSSVGTIFQIETYGKDKIIESQRDAIFKAKHIHFMQDKSLDMTSRWDSDRRLDSRFYLKYRPAGTR